MCATYSEKSKKAHFDSFANKILTGIKEIIPEYAEKRAIWELFQNALDIVDDNNGHLIIEATSRGLKFSHNGKPFKDDNLGALVKQYSNGKTYGSNDQQIGQYGTGFLSTHVYGRTIILNGSVQVDDGSFRLLKDFQLDRSANSMELLSESLIVQDNKVEEICDGVDYIIENATSLTTFEYLASKQNMDSINSMLNYIHNILPFIFCFNEKLFLVDIVDSTGLTTYQKISANDNQLNIEKNKVPISLDFIQCKKPDIKIVFPQKGLNFTDVPKFFLSYPLMETSGAGINFLIHAQEFKPNKERDYLHIKASNEEIQLDVTINKELLKKSYDLIISKIKEDTSIDFFSIANILYVDQDDDFEKNLKESYIDEIKCLKRLSVNGNYKDICEVVFFNEELLCQSPEVLKAFYNVFTQFIELIEFEMFVSLSEIVCNWEKAGIKNLKIINIKEILSMVSHETKANYNAIKDQYSYSKIIQSIATNIDLLNEIPLVPNIHAELKAFNSLVKWEETEPHLIQILDALHVEGSNKYLHHDYYFITNIKAYNRNDFKEDFSKFCNDLNDALSKGYDIGVGGTRFYCLVYSLCYFIGLNGSSELNSKLYSFFVREFKIIITQSLISSPTVGMNYQPAFKLLSRMYINLLKIQPRIFIETNTNTLLELVVILDSNINLKEELLDKLACFPSQNYYLKAQNELKIDQVLDEEFKAKYHAITGKDCKDGLTLSKFNSYLQHKDSVTGVQLGDEIEMKLDSRKVFIPIAEQNLNVVLDLIKHISINPISWGNWLPNINQFKEEILMHKFQDINTRTSLFNILSEDEDKINLLGKLAGISDLEALIEAGEAKQKEQHRQENHKGYIKKIGLQIQNLIERQLDKALNRTFTLISSSSDSKLKTIEEQNGQDFIIYCNNLPIYYIEVKSRWDSDGIVALSKRQVECCAKSKGIYAVITVNVADYKSRMKVVMDDISFEDLNSDIYINTDLSDNFEELIKENNQFEKIAENTKLIEFRGHIPQERIKKHGVSFDHFITDLKAFLMENSALKL